MPDGPDASVVLDPSFLAGMGEHGTDELRRLRAVCEQLEATLSYRRRILQGHLDLLAGELARREVSPGGVAQAPTSEDIGRLLGQLGDRGRASDRSPSHQRLGAFEVEAADLDVVSVDLPDRTDQELRDRFRALVAKELEISAVRRVVLDRLDAIQAEVVSRYRDGRTSIDEVLPPSAQ